MPSFEFRRSIEVATNIRALVYRHQIHHSVVLMKLDGYLDNGNTPAFLGLCRTVLEGTVLVFGLDLSAVSYISSTGVGAFSSLAMDTKRAGGFFFLTGVPDKIKRVLETLGFAGGFKLIENPDSFDFGPFL